METFRKVLLVDDDATCLYITKKVLQKSAIKAEILTAYNGQEALTIVKEACRKEQCPELILLDINMPVMDGFGFLEEVQKSADLRNAPLKIVLLSSSANRLDLARVKQFPVFDYIQKPLTPEKLSKFL